MALSIKNAETEALARRVAAATGETVTEAIRVSLEEREQKISRKKNGRTLKEELMEIGRRCAALPVICDLTDDEILGYDENGAPTR